MTSKRMPGAFGVGGLSVDTVLDTPRTAPGEVLTGQMRIRGGDGDTYIDRVALSLVTRIGVEHGPEGTAEFLHVVVARDLRVAANQPLAVPFRLPVPWEAPLTAVGGHPLPGTTVGVRTGLVVDGVPHQGDPDPLLVGPLPSQDRVLEAFGQLGFQFHATGVETGRLPGADQELDFHQEIGFSPPRQFAGRVDRVELAFVAGAHGLVVALEADRRGGAHSPGPDAFGRFHTSHADAMTTDWSGVISRWLAQVVEHDDHDFAG